MNNRVLFTQLLATIPCMLQASEPFDWHLMIELSPAEIVDIYFGKSVISKGFVYQHPSGKWILAAEPNLKSCCLGKKTQLWLAAEKLDLVENTAVALEGTLTTLQDIEGLMLTQARLDPEAMRTQGWLPLLFGIFFIGIAFFVWNYYSTI